MEHCLNMPHIAANVVGHLRSHYGILDWRTLSSLATTTRSLSEAALDELWAAPNEVRLAKQMDPSFWSVRRVELQGDSAPTIVLNEEQLADAPGSLLGDRFHFYAKRVQKLGLSLGGTRLSVSVLRAWTQGGAQHALFPRLRELELDQWYHTLLIDTHVLPALLSMPAMMSFSATLPLDPFGMDQIDQTRFRNACARLKQVSLFYNSNMWHAQESQQLAGLYITGSRDVTRFVCTECIPTEYVPHMYGWTNLVYLDLTLMDYSASAPAPPPTAFRSLHTLHIEEMGSEPGSALQFVLELSLSTPLREFDYKTRGTALDACMQLASHITRLPTLQDITVPFMTDNGVRVTAADCAAFFQLFHALPGLRKLKPVGCGSANMQMDREDVQALLRACPVLEGWGRSLDAVQAGSKQITPVLQPRNASRPAEPKRTVEKAGGGESRSKKDAGAVVSDDSDEDCSYLFD